MQAEKVFGSVPIHAHLILGFFLSAFFFEENG
jgi:hypothetical protein